MTTARVLPWLLAGIVCAAISPAQGGDLTPAVPRTVDPAKAKAQEAERQRLIAKLRGDIPKEQDTPAKTSPLDLPIFHRHDKP
jgi:hypothetical protein